ncbi:hypothetical protein JAAARDRAFT_123771 [Jaapia argillacea MUCL 33604]|uniref:Mitochondrial carrier n=1 Tax=Jaapia argillacea MUCL 33604 TaxID=933084 RepID=A0A067Q3R7_9AGAM|nr:hypothetical protein JAAARDRAFT_123771 [Jaapia argillacea MUCL 33604]
MPSNEDVVHRSHLEYLIRSTIAGGFAGGVAKTAVAPLERVKILFQTHHHDYAQFTGSWRGVIQALVQIFRTQGFLGLYRGHSLTLARAVPHAAIGYTAYEGFRKLLMPSDGKQTPARGLVAGALAGLVVLPVTYPFEVVRVRMAVETQRTHVKPKLTSVFSKIYREPPSSIPFGGLLHFYRGFAVTAVGTIPYRGGIFLVWETLNAYSRQWFTPEFHGAHLSSIHLVIGALAGTGSQIATYPLEVIRRVQQASGSVGSGSRLGSREVVTSIWRRSGWKGYYAGLGIGLVKQVPMHSISLSVWQASKRFLGV